MQTAKWWRLGKALKALRLAQDIGQKEIIYRSGEAMVERTLRVYESGKQRPSRDRLLKLLIKSFDVKSAAEINRYLQMASYAPLGASDIQQFGLGEFADKTKALRSSLSPGKPAHFRTEVSTLIVLDDQGAEVWRYRFPSRFAPAAYDEEIAIRRCAFADIDADGDVETLFVYVPFDFGSVGTTLLCFSADGELKWQFEPGRTVRDTTGREYCPPYFISNVRIVPISTSKPRILVSSNHYLHNPNQIATLDSTGHLISEYWHSGHLLYAACADLNGDGIEEILLAGVNNGYRQATMIIFDPRRVSGVSSQPGRQILGFDPGTEKAILLFPKTCVSSNAPYTRVAELRITRERRIMLAVAEGVSESKNPGVMIYELDFGLKVISARPDSHLQERHRELEAEGILDHSWTEEESENLRRQIVLKGGL